MHTHLIAVRKKGFQLDEEYAKLVLAAYPICMGAGIYHNGSVSLSYFNLPEGKPIPLETLKEIDALTKEHLTMFCWGASPSGFSDQDMQPFCVIGGSGPMTASVAACISGDFSRFTKGKHDKSVHSHEYHYFCDRLFPKISRIWKLVKDQQDPVGYLMSELEQPDMKDEILNDEVGAGDIVLLGSNGKTLQFSNNTQLHKDLPFGWVSNHLGYGEKKETEKTKEAEPASGGRIAALRAQLNMGTKSAITATSFKEGPTKEKEPDKAFFEFPKLVHNKERKDLQKREVTDIYTKGAGYCPHNWRAFPTIPRIKTGQNAEQARQAWIKECKARGEDTDQDSKTPVGSVPAVASQTKEPERKTDPNAPITMPVEQQKGIMDDFLKEPKVKAILDADTKEMPDPKKLAETEGKRAKYSQLVKLANGIEGTFRWTDEMMLHHIKKYPEASLFLVMELRSNVIQLMADLEGLTGSGDTSGTGTLKNDPPKSGVAAQLEALQKRMAG